MLWRRYQQKAQTPGKAEKGQKADEDDRVGRHPPKRVFSSFEIRQ